jgi:hypothetical protein
MEESIEMSIAALQARDGRSGRIPLSDLLLDAGNPRFGELESRAEQKDILELIVKKFGVEDVLSSISINGFFSAEPLICKPAPNGKYVVKEGNRRLTACLIIMGDERAVHQNLLHSKYNAIWRDHHEPNIEPIPVLIFEDQNTSEEALLSYLGVRHIAAAQPWDSYAKASWVAKITDTTRLSVSEVSDMIGDQHNTVMRLLEGYRFIRQLIEAGLFIPENSQRRGRGSVAEYPFSWVYTLLGYKAARNYAGLTEISAAADPIPPDKLENAALMVAAMFGDRATGRSAAVADSRQLIDLSRIFSDPEKVALIRAGKDVVAIEELTKPIDQRLEDNLTNVKNMLDGLVSGISANPPSATTVKKYLSLSRQVKNLANQVDKQLVEISEKDE